tara:strand:- start:1772 stop:2146 length:375 start_codon:yes stop_codon:yes gene_type:complete
MDNFDLKKYLAEGKLLKENAQLGNYPQVDIEVQGKIYTIPVNLEDRERIFGDAEYNLDDYLESYGYDVEGRAGAALASDLTQSDFTDPYGNEDVKTFNKIKSLGVQVDSLYGMLDDKIQQSKTK